MRKFFTFIILGLILISCSNSQKRFEFRDINYVFNSVSPTISSVMKLNETDKETAVADLIKKGYEQGFPIVEIDSIYPDYVFATFFYIDTTHRHEIELEVFGIYDEYRLGDRKLYQLGSTDLYYRSYLFPNDLCLAYRFILTDISTGGKQIVSDPLNNNLSPTGERKDFSWSVLDLRPDEPDWYTKRYNNAGSRLDTFEITSKILNNTRNIYVYIPPAYSNTNHGYPVIYLFDSFIYLNRIEVPNVLDNLILEKKIEPMIAVFIDNPTSTSRKYEFPMNPLFRDFVITELIPEIKSNYHITDNPAETIVGGISYGGLAAAYLAFECDSLFGKVLSQSGGFWRDMNLTDAGGAEYRGDWLINQYAKEKKHNIKLFLDWGLQENMVLGANRKFVTILDRMDYNFKFIEFDGWHCWSNSRKTFPEGLLYLMEQK